MAHADHYKLQIAAFLEDSGKIDKIDIADGYQRALARTMRQEVVPGINDCRCGCHGDYTEHSMRAGESGRYSSEIVR